MQWLLPFMLLAVVGALGVLLPALLIDSDRRARARALTAVHHGAPVAARPRRQAESASGVSAKGAATSAATS
jgi:hypothetical protein